MSHLHGGIRNRERLKLSPHHVCGKQVSGTLVTVSDSTADIIMCGEELKHEDPKTGPERHPSCQLAHHQRKLCTAGNSPAA